MDSSEGYARWWSETGERQLRQVLLWRWDPVGVSAFFPDAADEYDGYAPQIAQLLRGGATPEDLAEHLAGVEREQMGRDVAAERLRDVAAFLVAWYETSTTQWQEFGRLGEG